jgi:hypothetical protein
MARTMKQDSSVIRLTRWQAHISFLKKKGKENPKDEYWTLYGVDAEGNEKVYAQIPSNQWEEWSKTDPLWNHCQKAMFRRLLSHPKTRDTLIKINLKSALEKGDKETAEKLWEGLSASAKVELIPKPEA